jgi:membrane protein involved in colicin uptake
VHSNVSSAEASLRAAADFLAEADRVLEKAVRQQNEKRFLNARTTAEKAVSAFDKVTDAYKQAIRICKDLDQKKHTFESQLARMESNRQAAEQKIAGYGRSSSLTYRAPKFNITSALDYTTLQRQLDEQQAVWDQEARAAQNAYEAEQERQRRQRAEAARRQRELEEAAESARRAERRRREAAEEAAEAARRSSYSHSSYGGSSYGSSGGSSSSSSSSWGSSGSSSSDTSWGSSSDSSSSSSSSSDTSW